jgi:hypothetical protein
MLLTSSLLSLIVSAPPLEWHCYEYQYGDGYSCDCGCGIASHLNDPEARQRARWSAGQRGHRTKGTFLNGIDLRQKT